MATIGLDIGTTGCKATIVDRQGYTICQDYCEYDVTFPRDGWVELDPEIVWNAAETVLSNVTKAYDKPISSMSIASFGEAAVLLDKERKVIANSIFYTDIRGNDCIEELTDMLGRSWIEDITGMPLNGMYTLLKLMWIRRNRPELYEKIDLLLPFGAFIAFRLTGEAVSDYSLASRTLMFNRHSLTWDHDILRAFGLSAENLPRLVPSGEPVARVLPSVASQLGLPKDILIVSGGHDQVAAAVGAGAVKSGDAVDGIGSAECITAVLSQEANLSVLHTNNICAEPHAVTGQFVSLIFNNTAGAALKWYRNAFEEELHASCRQNGKNVYKVLDSQLSEQPSPILFLPYLSGTGTPYMDADAKGVLCGLTLSSTKQQIYRAIIEGMNYEMKYNLDILSQCGMRINVLTAVGGGASKAALQIKADIFQMPIRTLENQQSGNMGLAMLCAVAEGRYRDLQEAAYELVKIKEIIYPNSKYLSEYKEKYSCYSRMYRAERMIYGR